LRFFPRPCPFVGLRYNHWQRTVKRKINRKKNNHAGIL
jgi:hypothetical protein